MKDIKLKDILKKNLTIENYTELYQKWVEDRGAETEESVFDLYNYKDFYLFANFYNDVEFALECQKKNRFWIAGLAKMFENKKPMMFPNTIEGCKDFIDKCVEVETIYNRLDIYGIYFDYDKEYIYKKGNSESSKDLNYNVVLQWMTIVLWKCYEQNKDCFVEICEDDLMDIFANLAHEFWSIHIRTAWETTFIDYIYHFIINELNIHSSLWNGAIEDGYEKLVDYFKNQGGYWG